MHMYKMPMQNPLELLIYTLKRLKGRRTKQGLFPGWLPVGGGRA
jgi:hypothetical protein